MRPIKLFGLCLIVALAIGAVASSAASAAEPVFELSGETKAEALSSKGGALKLETTKGEEIKCEGMTAKGEIESASEVIDFLPVFNGCTTTILGKTLECQSTGAGKKEIKVYYLFGRLGYLNKTENKVGLRFEPEPGRENNPNNLFAEFECIRGEIKTKASVKGSIIGLITPVEKPVTPGEHFLLDFEKGEGQGVQKDTHFEGEVENKLLTATSVSKGFVGSAIEGSMEIFPGASTKIINSPIVITPASQFKFNELKINNQKEERTFTYKNEGAANWTPNIGIYQLPPKAGGMNGFASTNTCNGNIIATKKTCTVTVEFGPKELGKYDGWLRDAVAPTLAVEGLGIM
jgi:hypothetical protein